MARELFNGASVRCVITQVAPSARVMPVSALPARKSARNRPDLQKAGAARPEISVSCRAPPGRFPPGSLRQGSLVLPQQWFAPIASSLRASPVVTMRAMPQPTKTFRWLANVTTPRDGLPDPSSLSIVQRDPSSRPLPAGSVQCRAPKRQQRAPLRALGQRLTSMLWLPTGRHHRRQERVQPWQAAENPAQIGSGVPSHL